MRAENIEQIREHLARGGRVNAVFRAPEDVPVQRTLEQLAQVNEAMLSFDNSMISHWELLPIEEEVDDDSHLKPCPFCGGDADSMTYCGNDTIFCQACPAMMGGEESRATRNRGD